VVVATGDMVLKEDHERPIAVAAHDYRPPMIQWRPLMKSSARFRQKMVVQWLLQAFVGVDATIFRQVRTGIGRATKREGLPFNGFEGHQPTPCDTLNDLICQ